MSRHKVLQFLYLQMYLSSRSPVENEEDLYYGWFVEANYHVPTYSLVSFTGKEFPRTYKGVDRRGTYVMLENVFQK
jgi:hypothetical protein